MSAELISKNYPHTFATLNELVFPEKYSEYHASIAALAKSVYLGLPEKFKAQFEERALILSWLDEKRDGDLPCSELFKKIKKDKQITKKYIVACITCEISKDVITDDKVLFEGYKSLLIAVAIKLTLLGLRPDFSRDACLEVRMFAGGRRQDLVDLLPVIDEQWLADLKDQLINAKQGLDKVTQATFCNQLDHYLHPLDLLITGKNEEKNSRVQKRDRRNYNLVQGEVRSADTEGNRTVETHEDLKKGKKYTAWEREEQRATPADSHLFTVELQDRTNEPKANHLMARAFTHRLILRKKKLPTQLDFLDNYIQSKLYQYCIETPENNACQLILLVWITGLTAEELATSLFKWEGERLHIVREHKLPTYQKAKQFLAYLYQVKRVFKMPLPSIITLSSPLQILSAIDDAKAVLSKLNKQYHGNLTLERLRLNMRAKLVGKGIDSAIIGILCSDELQQQPALYYTLLGNSEIQQVHREYITNNIHSSLVEDLPPIKTYLIGSNLPIRDEAIVKQLSNIKEAYQQQSDTEIQFFYLAVYTYYIVALFSGYRPVSAMLGYFSDINFITGMYSISDKENRSGISTRNIVLPKIALKQIEVYKFKLEEIIQSKSYIYPLLANRCRGVFSEIDEEPWLFFVRNGDVEEPNFKLQENIFRRFFPMPPNWHRHWARTKLHSFNIPQDVCDGWIGHADIEEEGFSRFSALSLNDMKLIANCFDDWANKNGVVNING